MTIHQQLINAAEVGETETVRDLLKRGADANADRDLPLYLSVRNGHSKTWDLLLESGADLDSALLHGAKFGHTQAVIRLLDLGACINPDDDEEDTSALYLAAFHDHAPTAKLLAAKGADIHVALYFAAGSGKMNALKLLLELGAVLGVDKDSALCHAAENSQLAAVNLLLDEGADIHLDDDHLLRSAIEDGTNEMISLLLARGDYWKGNPQLALTGLAAIGRIGDVAILLNQPGVDIHIEKDAALRAAAARGQTDTVEFLLKCGANIHAEGGSPLCFAAKNGHVSTVNLLLDLKANIHAKDGAGLVAAIRSDHLEVVRVLLKRGANPRRKNHAALWTATFHGSTKMIDLLINRYTTAQISDLMTVSPNPESTIILKKEIIRRHYKKILKDTPELEI